MAGGKLSPRQKMINMMYLVLTALLALNVSSEILNAFRTLKDSIGESVHHAVGKNSDEADMIKGKIKEEIESGNNKNESLIAATDEIMAKSDEVMKYINKLQGDLNEIAGLDEKTGEMKGMKEMEANWQLWMGPGGGKTSKDRGKGEAKKLKDKLDGFVTWANEFVTRNAPTDSTGKKLEVNDEYHWESFCADHKESKEFKGGASWEFATFHSKPVVADLAMVEKLKLDVTNVQYGLLSYIKERLGAVKFKIDSLIVVDAPTSRVVAAGMQFETKLFVAMSSSDVKPEFSGSGSVKYEPGGNSAIMTMGAQGGFAKGAKEKQASYSYKAKVPKADGTYEVINGTGEFTVRKPEVQITSATVQNLYYQCGNTINVDVPALGEFYNPVIKCTGGDVLKSKSSKTKVTIVPTGKNATIHVSSNTNGQMIKIDDVKYKVIKPPKPRIVLLVNGKEYNGATPISKKSSCKIMIKPDTDFKTALPKDARYVVTNVALLAQESLGAPTKKGSFGGGGGTVKCSLGSKLRGTQPGTKIYFRIGDVKRKNFRNKVVNDVQFGERDLMIGAVVK